MSEAGLAIFTPGRKKKKKKVRAVALSEKMSSLLCEAGARL